MGTTPEFKHSESLTNKEREEKTADSCLWEIQGQSSDKKGDRVAFRCRNVLLSQTFRNPLHNRTSPICITEAECIGGSVMDSVLAKLTELTGDKGSNLMDLLSDIAFLRDELCAVNALLKKLEDGDELDPQVKDWSNQVRELGYDIEACIDEFVHRVGRADARAGFVGRISHFISTLRAHLEAARQIKELKTRLQEISERRKRYKLEHHIPGSSFAASDPRLPALYKETDNLVGLDGPRDELLKWVLDEKKQLKRVEYSWIWRHREDNAC